MQKSTKYAALSQRDQVVWTAALAALHRNPNLRGKATLEVTTTPAPEINAAHVRIALKLRGRTRVTTCTIALEQRNMAHNLGQMMLSIFDRAFIGAGRGYGKEAAK